ncbi:MAG: LysR substrate-binding domain-containing protein [Desulfohalobiaceae bacterium]
MLHSDLDIHLLRAFVTVARERSFTRAAARLMRTQSAVSMQLRRLEQNLGKLLLVRNSKRVRLTDSGETFLPFAERILRLNDEALNEMGQPEVRGKVRLGVPDDYAAYFLPRVLANFGALYPRIRLEVSCELSVNLPGKLASGDIDIALTTRQPQSKGGDFLRREQLVWAEAEQGRVHDRDPLPLALFPEGVCVFREAALRVLADAGRRWNLVCTSQGLAGIRSVVSSGLALTVVTENTLSPDMRRVPPEEGLPSLPSIDLALHRSRQAAGEAVEVFAEHIHQVLQGGVRTEPREQEGDSGSYSRDS